MEAYTPLNGAIGNAAPVGGKRRSSKKHLRLVTKKVARKALKKLGLKMRGGEGDAAAPTAVPAPVLDAAAKMGGADPEVEAAAETAPEVPATAGRRHRRHTKKTKRGGRKHHKRGLFGL